MLNFLIKFIKKENGQAMSEYGIVLAIIAVGAITALTALNGKLKVVIDKIADALGGL